MVIEAVPTAGGDTVLSLARMVTVAGDGTTDGAV